jgi:hypothetical protein
LHEGGFSIEEVGAGEWRFRDARGRAVDGIPADPSDGAWARDVVARWRAEMAVDDRTNFPGWDGEPVDYDAAVSALLD